MIDVGPILLSLGSLALATAPLYRSNVPLRPPVEKHKRQ